MRLAFPMGAFESVALELVLVFWIPPVPVLPLEPMMIQTNERWSSWVVPSVQLVVLVAHSPVLL